MEFIPKKNNKELISFRIEKELLDKIDALAHASDISRNAFMTQCLEFAISQMKEQ